MADAGNNPLTQAWKVSYGNALFAALETIIDGVRIPCLSLNSLIASKETDRDQDRADLVRRLAIRDAKLREGHAK